jgi:Ca-activated chloride channel family protein
MKNRVRAFLLLGLLVPAFAGAIYYAPDAAAQSTSGAKPTPTPPDPEEEEIRIDTEVVNILFTAQDKDRRLLLGLKKEDIRISEDGKAQDIVAFSRQVDLPLSLAILIDTSASQERTLPEEKMAAISFLESFIRPEKDEVAVVSFTGESTLEQGMTSNLTRLRRAIDKVRFTPPAGYSGSGVVLGTPPINGKGVNIVGSTAIWDAVWVTAEDVLGPAPERTRRAIILLSDGINTSGRKKLEEAVQAAQKSEAVIYSVGIGDSYAHGVDKGALIRISERTGGRAFFPEDERQLRQAFKQIEEEMRSQYLLAYEPTNPALDGSYRRLAIEVVNPELTKQKVKLTHREGYFAKDQRNKK